MTPGHVLDAVGSFQVERVRRQYNRRYKTELKTESYLDESCMFLSPLAAKLTDAVLIWSWNFSLLC